MSVLTGIMLSDGHIQQRTPTSNARFIFSQSGKIEKREYFNFILDLLLPFCTPGYVPYFKEWFDAKYNATYTSISLTTMQLPCFSILHKLWYEGKTKKSSF